MPSNYAYAKRWRHERAQGMVRTVPAEPVAAHAQALIDLGWSLRSIADAAHCSPSTIERLLHRGHQRTNAELAGRIMSVTPEAILSRRNGAGFVANLGARRRIQALLALGWRHEDITAAMVAGQPEIRTTSIMVLHQVGDWIARTTHDAVDHAYEQLSGTPGPSRNTRGRAAKLGYVPPLAWDEGTIDDPAARPVLEVDEPVDVTDEVALERGSHGKRRLTKPERIAAVRQLTMSGKSAREISEQLRITIRQVQRDRYEGRITFGSSPLPAWAEDLASSG